MHSIAREISTHIEAGEQTITARITVTFCSNEEEEKKGRSDMFKERVVVCDRDASRMGSGMRSKTGSKHSYYLVPNAM